VHLERHPDFHVGSGLIVVGTMAAMERIFGHEQGRSQFPVLRNQIRMPRMSARPQAETRKKKQDCFVANAVRLREVARGNPPVRRRREGDSAAAPTVATMGWPARPDRAMGDTRRALPGIAGSPEARSSSS